MFVKKLVVPLAGLQLQVAVIILLFVLSRCDEDKCSPDVGQSGPADTIGLLVETWETRTSNFHTSDPERLSARFYTVRREAGVVRLEGIEARFYGTELCFAVKKYTETEKNNGDVDRSSSCEKSCLSSGSGTRVTIYRSTGTKITSQNPFCCTWGTTKELRLSIPAPPTQAPPSYQCVDCSGDSCTDPKPKVEACDAGDKCYTLKLQRTSEVVTVKGCSSKLHYWGKGLACDYKCKSNVRLDEYAGRYRSVCVSCCTGNSCNSGDTNSSAHTTTTVLSILPVILLSIIMLL